MRRKGRASVRRVAVIDHPHRSGVVDYADAFEAELPQAEELWPEVWLRAGMQESPAVVEWIAERLGLGQRPDTTSPAIANGHVIESTPRLVEVEWLLPLASVVVIARHEAPSTRRLSSFLYYTRPILGRAVWSVVGVGHRRLARRLIARNDAGMTNL